MNTTEAITTLNAVFNHKATEIHCVVGKFITGMVNGTMRVSSVVCIGHGPYPEQEAISALCELFPGGPCFVSELHVYVGDRIEAMVFEQNDKGKKFVRFQHCDAPGDETMCARCAATGDFNCGDVAKVMMTVPLGDAEMAR